MQPARSFVHMFLFAYTFPFLVHTTPRPFSLVSVATLPRSLLIISPHAHLTLLMAHNQPPHILTAHMLKLPGGVKSVPVTTVRISTVYLDLLQANQPAPAQ